MPQNIRQIELKARLEDMIKDAKILIVWEINAGNKAPYEKEFDLEHFLARYRTLHGVGHYASQRYFKDFETLGYFIKTSKDTFKVDYETIKNNYYSVLFPKPEGEKA